jgi:hypothetical protein
MEKDNGNANNKQYNMEMEIQYMVELGKNIMTYTTTNEVKEN